MGAPMLSMAILMTLWLTSSNTMSQSVATEGASASKEAEEIGMRGAGVEISWPVFGIPGSRLAISGARIRIPGAGFASPGPGFGIPGLRMLRPEVGFPISWPRLAIPGPGIARRVTGKREMQGCSLTIEALGDRGAGGVPSISFFLSAPDATPLVSGPDDRKAWRHPRRCGSR